MNANQLLAEIRKLTARQPDVIPPGFKSARQMATEWGKSRAAAEVLLWRALAGGLVERKKFLAPDAKNKVTPIWFYKPTGKRAPR